MRVHLSCAIDIFLEIDLHVVWIFSVEVDLAAGVWLRKAFLAIYK